MPAHSSCVPISARSPLLPDTRASSSSSGSSACLFTVWQWDGWDVASRRSFNGETVVLSGGQRLDGLSWQRSNAGNGEPVVQARLPVPANFTSLFVGAKRAIRARWPNGDPATVSGLCLRRQSTEAQEWGGFPAWTPTCEQPGPNRAGRTGWSGPGGGWGDKVWPTKARGIPGNRSRSGPTYPSFASCTGGAAENFDPPFNAWCCGGGSNVQTGFSMGGPSSKSKVPQQLGTPGQNWSNTEAAVIHSFHPLLWGGCAFHVLHADTASGNVSLGEGGWQNSRGCNLGIFYAENILEELDDAREWYLAPDGRTLYYQPAAHEGFVRGRPANTDADPAKSHASAHGRHNGRAPAGASSSPLPSPRPRPSSPPPPPPPR